jgi:hypothetical protein
MSACACGCGEPVTPGSAYAHTDRCRQRAYRQKVEAEAEQQGVPSRVNLAVLSTGTGLRNADAPPTAHEPTRHLAYSQKDRVLMALHHGPVTPVDFAAPNVIDGLNPIMRLARVIGDLEKDGHLIGHGLVKTLGRARVARYELLAEAAAVPPKQHKAKRARAGLRGRWIAISDHGEWCGHWHWYFTTASRCVRSQERYFRLRYGQRQDWNISELKVPDGLTSVTENADVFREAA